MMVNLIRLGFVCVVLVVQEIRGCPQGWELFEESCYFVPDMKKDWTAASTYCGLYKGHLADVANANEESFLKQLITKHYKKHGGHSYYWLGGTDEAVEGEWRWITTGQSINYTHWAQGEPNDLHHHNHHHYVHGEDCLTANISAHSQLHWVDRVCTYKCPFVCKLSPHWIHFG